jgi:predicted DNA-binding transcriptional regulator AlpA
MTQTKLIQIENLESTVLLGLFNDLNKRLDQLTPAIADNNEVFITRHEVAELFKISLPTVHAWMNAGILKPYKIANKTRFLRSEVVAAAKDISRKGGNHE